MPISNYPAGFAQGISIRGVPLLNTHAGKVFWVYNGTALLTGQKAGSDGNKGTFDAPFSTIDYAIGQCTANRGDIILVKAGHAETLTAASAITCDVAGVAIIGLGDGTDRPELTFGTATTASIVISADNVTWQNFACIGNIDALTNPWHVQAADCYLDFEWRDASSTVEAARAVLTTAAADRLKLKIKYRGQTGGDACVNAVRLVGVDGAEIDIDFYGKASTSVIEFLTTACTNVNVKGYMYVSGTTDGSKNVIDTVTGSTWYAEIEDGAAGAPFSGGSASALAKDDVSAVTDALYGANGIATFPSGAAAANNVSMAEVLRYIQDQVINGTGTALDANTSLYGVLAGATGIPTFPASALPANGVSIAEVLREKYDQQEKAVTNTTAALVNGTTIFTIAGGPIEILSLVARCVTGNDATASTLQWSADPTDGAAATFSAASVSLANALAGATVVLQGTTLATAPIVNTSGVGLGQQVTNGIIVGAGIITTTVGVGSTTGTWQHHLRYRPLARGVTVT